MEQKFTTLAQEAIGDAIQSASAAGNAQVDSLHLLDALLRQQSGVVANLLKEVRRCARRSLNFPVQAAQALRSRKQVVN